jgi:hypothetical protein
VSERLPTYVGFRDFLWDVLPEAREHILDEESHWTDEGAGTYTLMSVFRRVLDEAAKCGDIALVRRCLALLERMIVDGDDNLQDPVQIRVLDKDGLTTELPHLYRAFAGPLTRRGLGYRDADLTYLPPDWPLPEPPVADGRPDAAAQAARSWLWKRVPASRYYLIMAELAEVRPTMSLAAMTPDRYFAAALHGMLADATETAALGNPRPVDEVMAMLESMLADPATAPLVHRRTGEITGNLTLRVYAGVQLGALFGE